MKKSILENFLDMILPFYCRGCGGTGQLLCDDCKARLEIIGEVKYFDGWGVLPGKKERLALGEINRLFVGGIRGGALKILVEDYKFKSVKRISAILTEVLDETVPSNLTDVVIVPLPTIGKHIRTRGFDHTLRLAREFGAMRGWPVVPILKRVNKTVQVGADEKTREKQAKGAYEVDMEKVGELGLAEKMRDAQESGVDEKLLRLEADKTYLLLDDVWTTGASMRAAAEKLRMAGAEKICATVVEISVNQVSDR